MPFLHPAAAAAASPAAAAAAAAVRKQINRNFTQDQEIALATEVVDGEIWIEVWLLHLNQHSL